MALQLILGLSLLVAVHEFGHFITARMFGMRVEKFFVGFPPKVWSKKVGDTEYGIGAIPLGGFVKIAGMIDESMDMDKMAQEPQPWEFRSKPAWQRLIVMMGGIIVNVIVGIIIFIALFFTYGEDYIPIEEANRHGIYAYPLAQELGLETGDKIVKINGEHFRDFSSVEQDVLLEDNAFYTVLRGENELKIDIPDDFLDKKIDRKDESFIGILTPFSVDSVLLGTGAGNAGLQKGDSFISINGQAAAKYPQLKEILAKNKSTEVTAIMLRGMDTVTTQIAVDEQGLMGFIPDLDLNLSHRNFSFGESIPAGAGKAFGAVLDNIKGFKKIFTGKVSATKALHGPQAIAVIYGGTWVWKRFWSITGLLSMILAFMNFLPIPALDGGHVAFLTYEMVSGRTPSDKFMEIAQKIGMVILLSLMVFVIGNDLIQSIIGLF